MNSIAFGMIIFIALVIQTILTRAARERREENVAVVYATLIISGKKTFSQVPVRIREQVRQVLIDLDLEELTTED